MVAQSEITTFDSWCKCSSFGIVSLLVTSSLLWHNFIFLFYVCDY